MKKRKIAIVTIISENYGNRLQNYALQEYLKKMGFDVYTVPYKTNISIKAKAIIKSCLSFLFVYFRNRWIWERFNRIYIQWANQDSNNSVINDRYHYFIAGSDQIWNPLFYFNSRREFLTFSKKEKRIAYAASIGLDKLPDEYLEQYEQDLNNIPNISVREDKAADIIYKLTNRRVPIVIDPTLLLTRSEWSKVISSCKIKLPDRYIVKYFIGMRIDDYEKYIDERAKKEGLEIIDLQIAHRNSHNSIGPLEFVYYIAHSEGTYVDSFHGAVFSILFLKSFIVFERSFEEGAGLMTSRLDTLLSTFGLTDRMVKGLVQLDKLANNCDFSKVEDVLLTKRKEALNYLREALDLDAWTAI